MVAFSVEEDNSNLSEDSIDFYEEVSNCWPGDGGLFLGNKQAVLEGWGHGNMDKRERGEEKKKDTN